MRQCNKTDLFRKKKLLHKKAKTKTKIKYRKDQTCAIFSKSRECKDIKYDIVDWMIKMRTFKEFQGLQGLSGNFKDFPGLSRTFKEFQGLQGHSRRFKDFKKH